MATPSGNLREYDPAQILQTVGTRAVIGVMKGTFVEVDRKEDSADTDVGSDGEVTLIIKQNRAGTIKITLQASSPLNDYFNSLIVALEQRNTAQAIVPYLMTDGNGNTKVQTKQCWIKKPAKVVWSDAGEGREWILETGYLDTQPGSQAVI